MGEEKELTEIEEREASDGRHGWGLVLGAALGYSVGRLFLNKPIVGLVLGAAAAFLIGSSDGEDE